MNREEKWMKKRLGRITASELGSITSASGKIIDGNVSYIRSKRWERNHGFALPVSSKAMEWGKENEHYAVMWHRACYPETELIYAQDLDEIPFWENSDVKNFGASPDAFTEDESFVLEVKNVYSNSNIEFFFDPATSYEEKKSVVAKEHIDQILGQFISNPKVQVVRVLKYCAQNDDIPQDTDSPVAPWRGIVFDFKREEYESSIEDMIGRIDLFNAFISSDINPSEFKNGKWETVDGELSQIPAEEKKSKK